MKEGEGDLVPEAVPETEEVGGEVSGGEQEPEQEVGQEAGGEQETQGEEFHEGECEETSPGQHNSSGYASDGSGAGNNDNIGGQPAADMAPTVAAVPATIQSDPQQSAFRPAGMPGPPAAAAPVQYHDQQQHAGPAGAGDQYGQYRGQQPSHGWQPEPADMSAYGPPIGMMTQATPHPMMHTPIARRPITGNMSGYPAPQPQPGYRPGNTGPHYPTSPGGGQYRQAPAGAPQYSGAQVAGWGSPNWSANGPGGPPPMSMTPPPLSWNQPNNQRRHPNYQNKPFGNVQYGGGMQQHQQIRSKNYPFPTNKAMTGDYMDEMRGPLDNMRSLEHYLPDGGQRHDDMGGHDASGQHEESGALSS